MSTISGLSNSVAYRRAGSSLVRSPLELFKSRYALHVILLLGHRPRHFNQLVRELDISSNTLRKRLVELEDGGFVRREVVNASPLSVRYSLLPRGEDLARVAGVIREWEEKWGKTPPHAKLRRSG